MDTNPPSRRNQLACILVAALLAVAVYRAMQRNYVGAAENAVFAAAAGLFALDKASGRTSPARAWAIGALVILGLILAYVQ